MVVMDSYDPYSGHDKINFEMIKEDRRKSC